MWLTRSLARRLRVMIHNVVDIVSLAGTHPSLPAIACG